MRLIQDVVIAKNTGRIFTLKKGQTLWVIEAKGPQAADVIIFNEHGMKDNFSAWLTRQNSECFTRAKKLYSKLPARNAMFIVLTEKDGMF